MREVRCGNMPKGSFWVGLGCVVAAALGTALLSVGPWDAARGDIGEYARYAGAFWHGIPPFRSLPNEYPPLALGPFSLTLLPAGAPIAPFVAGCGVLFVAGYVWCARLLPAGTARRYALYLLLGAQGTLLVRYDLFPALLTLAALWSATRGRFVWAYALLAVGAALKLYPLVVLPPVAIAHYRFQREQRGDIATSALIAAAGASLGAIVASSALLVPNIATRQPLSWLDFAATRPVQVESVPGTLVWLGTFAGIPASVESSFGSQGFVGRLADVSPTPALALFAVGYAVLCWRQARGRLALLPAALAALCLLLVTGRVLSAQYLVWVLPLAAAVGGSELWWIAIAALTSVDYPLLFPYSHGLPPLNDPHVWPFLLAVALRNVLLVGITLRLLAAGRAAITVSPTAGATAAAAQPAHVAAAGAGAGLGR